MKIMTAGLEALAYEDGHVMHKKYHLLTKNIQVH